ncbi:hypothetical protein L7F22_027264 [Adiantum nelumboides]|nr:hypothetical protein [Adiantum nelumboides]
MPRNVLNIPPKASTLSSSSLSKVLRSHISEHFTDTHPDAFTDDLKQIARLHDHIVHMDTHVSNIESAQKYLAQLAFMITKFPSDLDLAFPWTIAFPPTLSLFNVSLVPDESPPASPGVSREVAKSYAKTTTSSSIIAHPSLHYERAALLFSLASLYSTLGAQESRSEGESIRRAISFFQSSAGVLQYIIDELVPLLRPLFTGRNARFSDPDLQPAMLACLRDAMLAQAQECFWQKAVVDRLKDVAIAKLASRVSELYSQALEYAETGGSIEPLEVGAPQGCELPREWINHMTIKKWHFAAAAQFRKSSDDLSANRYGDELGRLKLAESHVKQAMGASRTGVSTALQNDLKSLQGAIQANLTRAMKDNDLIYLEAVTPASKLTAIPAVVMVEAKIPIEISQPIQFLRDSPSPAFGKPLFQELVPYGVHLAISVFDERKDSLVREEIELKRQELDSLATSTLQSLDLPGSLQALEQPIGLPPAVMRKSDEIRSEGGMDRLNALSEDVRRVAEMAAGVWNEIVHLIRQAPAPNTINHPATVHMSERHNQQASAFDAQTEEYRQTLQQARSSDQIVQQKLQEWKEIIETLAKGQDALNKFVPGQKRATSMTGEQNATVRALRVEMEALDDLMDSRASVCEEAKSKAKRQDIRNDIMREAGIIASGQNAPLVIESAHFEPLFERSLAIYDPMRSELIASEKSQQDILDRIAERNEAFVQARKVDANMQKRQEALQTLDLGYAKYREISANLVEGLKFYNAMVKMLHELRENVAGWVHQRQDEMADLSSKMEQASLAATAVTNQSNATPTKRRTRAAAKAASSVPEQDQPQPPQPPNWGAWQGGDIRFAD